MRVNILTNLDAAYLAGIVDGEGSIGLNQIHGNDLKRTTTYTIRLRITSTDKNLLDWVSKTVGFGSVRPIKNYDYGKQAYEWYLANSNVVDLLKQLYPYMIVKREQAGITFDYVKTISPSGKKLPLDIVELRQELKNQITQLNA